MAEMFELRKSDGILGGHFLVFSQGYSPYLSSILPRLISRPLMAITSVCK